MPRFARFAVLLALPLAAVLTACEDDPFVTETLLTRDTVSIGLPAGAEALPSALDLVRGQDPSLLRYPELVFHAEQWDFALRRPTAGSLALRPYTAPGSGLRPAGIATASGDFEAIAEAPRTASSYSTETVPIALNASYFLRSRQALLSVGATCFKYAKVKVLALDAAAGTAQLVVVINENCDDERLVED